MSFLTASQLGRYPTIKYFEGRQSASLILGCADDSISNFLLFVPLLPVHQPHGLEAGAVLDLSGHGLGALDAALGHVEGNVHAGGDGPGREADGELPQELQGRVLEKEETVLHILVENISRVGAKFLNTDGTKHKYYSYGEKVVSC